MWKPLDACPCHWCSSSCRSGAPASPAEACTREDGRPHCQLAVFQKAVRQADWRLAPNHALEITMCNGSEKPPRMRRCSTPVSGTAHLQKRRLLPLLLLASVRCCGRRQMVCADDTRRIAPLLQYLLLPGGVGGW